MIQIQYTTITITIQAILINKKKGNIYIHILIKYIDIYKYNNVIQNGYNYIHTYKLNKEIKAKATNNDKFIDNNNIYLYEISRKI